MDRGLFRTIIMIYLVLLLVTGALAVLATGSAAFPPPEEFGKLQTALADAEIKGHFMKELAAIAARGSKLAEAAANAFQVVLGALIGFLTAAGAAMTQHKSN